MASARAVGGKNPTPAPPPLPAAPAGRGAPAFAARFGLPPRPPLHLSPPRLSLSTSDSPVSAGREEAGCRLYQPSRPGNFFTRRGRRAARALRPSHWSARRHLPRRQSRSCCPSSPRPGRSRASPPICASCSPSTASPPFQRTRWPLLDYWRVARRQQSSAGTNHSLGLSSGARRRKNFTDSNRSQILSCPSAALKVKNHLALLDACEQLWARGLHFELHLIGLTHPQTGRAALDKIAALKCAPAGHCVTAARWTTPRSPPPTMPVSSPFIPRSSKASACSCSRASPTGKPCAVCSGIARSGEAARDGGCVALDFRWMPAHSPPPSRGCCKTC